MLLFNLVTMTVPYFITFFSVESYRSISSRKYQGCSAYCELPNNIGSLRVRPKSEKSETTPFFPSAGAGSLCTATTQLMTALAQPRSDINTPTTLDLQSFYWKARVLSYRDHVNNRTSIVQFVTSPRDVDGDDVVGAERLFIGRNKILFSLFQ